MPVTLVSGLPNLRFVGWLLVTVRIAGALEEPTVTPEKSREPGLMVTGRRAMPLRGTVAVNAVASERTVRTVATGPASVVGENLTVIVQLPPLPTCEPQPVVLKGAVVVMTRVGRGTDWLLVSVSASVSFLPWNVGGKLREDPDSAKGMTLVPVNEIVCGLVLAAWLIVSVAFSVVPGGDVGRNATAILHDVRAGMMAGQPDAA